MPIPLSLSPLECEQLMRLDARISSVTARGVLGANPIVRVRWEGRDAALKLFANRAIQDNERRALRRLRSRHVPRLLAHGTIGPPGLSLDGAPESAVLRGWLARDWVAAEPPGLPLLNPAAFVQDLERFAKECSAAGLRMGDPKRANFSWNGRRMVWLDFGWFYPSRPEAARQDNREFVDRLLRRLGW